jgi:hypothetical protein
LSWVQLDSTADAGARRACARFGALKQRPRDAGVFGGALIEVIHIIAPGVIAPEVLATDHSRCRPPAQSTRSRIGVPHAWRTPRGFHVMTRGFHVRRVPRGFHVVRGFHVMRGFHVRRMSRDFHVRGVPRGEEGLAYQRYMYIVRARDWMPCR